MKKLILILIIVIFVLTGCTKSENIPAESNFAVKEMNFSSDYKIREWVSPDGVHYWVIYSSSSYRFSMAPRYDSDGNLVIDDVER